jgi:hypothetical protein
MFVDRLDSNEFERFVDNGMNNHLALNLNKIFFLYLVVTITVDRLGDAKDPVNKRFDKILPKLNLI